jgi:hypothetical protein
MRLGALLTTCSCRLHSGGERSASLDCCSTLRLRVVFFAIAAQLTSFRFCSIETTALCDGSMEITDHLAS